MKKVMWGISLIPLVVTGIVLQFLPERLPMHYDLSGNIDRWGNKVEEFIFPISILLITVFWHMMISHFEKKAKAANTEKEAAEAVLNAKLFYIVGISVAIMFGIMHFVLLYGAYKEANVGLSHAKFDIARIACILDGIIFIVWGNFMPKTKKNHTIGVRTTWSKYNDNTWRKSNRFGAISLMIAGIITILTAVLVNGNISTIMMVVYLLVSSIATVIYSKYVYEQENKLGNKSVLSD